jgi:mannose-1-phosphate guanylyltransferase
MIQVTPVILCGGSGTRLWPLSRTGFPKQFLCLTGNESLFQQEALRLASIAISSQTGLTRLRSVGRVVELATQANGHKIKAQLFSVF